jgi:hypothetical protein
MNEQMKPQIQDSLGDDWDEWLEIADKEFDKDPVATQELEGMREAVNSKSPIKEDKLFQLLYEIASPLSCSGLLWADQNGTVIHGRNMDYAFHFNYTNKTTGETRVMNWPDVTHEVLFKRGGKPLFVSTAWHQTTRRIISKRPKTAAGVLAWLLAASWKRLVISKQPQARSTIQNSWLHSTSLWPGASHMRELF